MKNWMLSLGVVLAAVPALAQKTAAEVGKPAPAFTLTSHEGKKVSLADHKGKTVVLEWFNNECPYVKKHYDSGNMQELQAKNRAGDVVWLTINSSAPGKQGHLKADEAKKLHQERKMAGVLLLDPTGEVGKRYGAKTTPHMYIIDKEGKLVYAGAIDSDSSSDPKTIATAQNYVTQALAELSGGKPVATATTKPYGCAVKYE